ncbi:phage tail tube protein [Micromonospora carbonacea]|uniref:phage tail tube protein n=1 Tax=Micromonospora carbonacea TaxID=47853 RepID=UPI00371E4D30
MSQPIAVNTNGTMTALWVPAIANTAAPKVTELNAGTVLDLSCYLTGDGLTTETSENTIDDPRLCSKQIFEARGDFTDTMELTYVFNPASPDDDEARIALAPGTQGNIVLRWAVDFEDAIAVGDLVDVYPVEMGIQRKNTPARNSVHKITQKPFIIGSVQRDVAVVAGP